jgi:Flp pilus assembly protein CpaB
MLVLGVVLALAAFGGVLLFGSGSGSAQPAPTTVSVVTAAADISLGTALDSTMLVVVQKPIAEATDTYPDPAALLGKVVRRTVNAGVALSALDFAAGGAGNAAQVTSALKPGQVAIAVQIDGLKGVGGFIQEGDYVDVVLAQNVGVVLDATKGGTGSTATGEAPFTVIDGAAIDKTTVKVLVQNVQVLAHGVSVATTAADGSAAVDPATGQPVTDSQILILSVTAQQAEAIRYGQTAESASLQLILRAPGDVAAADVETTGVTLRELVDKWGVLPPQTVTVPYP